jgi:hypothetical protein
MGPMSLLKDIRLVDSQYFSRKALSQMLVLRFVWDSAL